MRESIGMTVLLNIVIIFLVITFGFLVVTLNYMKGFRTSSKIVNALERFEGYNTLSHAEAVRVLDNLGYTKDGNSQNCDVSRYGSNATLQDFGEYRVCIYETPDDENNKGRYFRFKVVTYIYVDIPLIRQVFRLPVVATSDRIFDFND